MIELTEKEITDLKLEVMKEMKQEMIAKLREDFEEHRLNIFYQIRKDAVSRCSQDIFGRISFAKFSDELVEQVQNQVQAFMVKEVKTRMAKGFYMSFKEQ